MPAQASTHLTSSTPACSMNGLLAPRCAGAMAYDDSVGISSHLVAGPTLQAGLPWIWVKRVQQPAVTAWPPQDPTLPCSSVRLVCSLPGLALTCVLRQSDRTCNPQPQSWQASAQLQHPQWPHALCCSASTTFRLDHNFSLGAYLRAPQRDHGPLELVFP